MNCSKDFFSRALFLRFPNNGEDLDVIREGFITNRFFKGPAVAIDLDDFTLWVTSNFVRNAELLPLSLETLTGAGSERYAGLEKLYSGQGITLDRYRPFIRVFGELRQHFCLQPTLYSEALLEHIRYTAANHSKNKDERRNSIGFSQLLPSLNPAKTR